MGAADDSIMSAIGEVVVEMLDGACRDAAATLGWREKWAREAVSIAFSPVEGFELSALFDVYDCPTHGRFVEQADGCFDDCGDRNVVVVRVSFGAARSIAEALKRVSVDRARPIALNHAAEELDALAHTRTEEEAE